ncbi:alpha-1,3-mannosyltransferase CMT1 [Daldinia vernicosa]|uniref:alpha-1,3-mannosyltransferase CMT1 n=1 Tax=Daldinia vernicosa TaxID=114800 RepID=UPI0020072B50|nr:alpha-1,3-mannosyltransferase CMT1 [Daldinia vernicosa]KAI0844235.1 alpha-1,3-mannosyltransferase CMT1 [Daldinia vernicosa]
MMKRTRLIFLQVACLLFIVFIFRAGYQNFLPASWSQGNQSGFHPFNSLIPSNTIEINNSQEVDGASNPVHPDGPWNTTAHIKAILDPTDTALPRLECPSPNLIRYEYLKVLAEDNELLELKYFFALDLRQSIDILPRLLGSIIETIKFLGPTACALSIVEGNSDDGTREVLYSLQPKLKDLGIAYYVQSSNIDPKTGERIGKLAQLRNLALSPLLSLASSMQDTNPNPSQSSLMPNTNTTIVFLNDVAICISDILELVHQRIFQSADMTCAMDWTYVGRDPTFYDVWVARTLQGDLFFDIPPDGNWNSAWNLFWNDRITGGRFSRTLPFQVFACWNGAVAFTAAPILGEQSDQDRGDMNRQGKGKKGERIGFRGPREGECYSGEPTLFCKDLWRTGHGRIAVVPSVNLEYSDEAASKIKMAKGYTSRWTEREDEDAMRIQWVNQPPDTVTCMPGLGDQTRRPWNETFT